MILRNILFHSVGFAALLLHATISSGLAFENNMAHATASVLSVKLDAKQPQGQSKEPSLDLLNKEAEQKIQAVKKEIATDDDLKEYRAIREEQMAQRVSEKARLNLVSWLTVNGLVLVIASIIGIKSIVDYIKKSATQRIDSVTEKRINEILAEEAKRLIIEQEEDLKAAAKKHIAEIVDAQKEELVDFARKQIEQVAVAMSPTKGIAQSPVEPEVSSGSIDLTPDMQPVRDNGNEGSVTGFAVAAALEYQIKKTIGRDVIISPRYIYYYARREGRLPVTTDCGSMIKDAITVISTRGAIPEEAWPYKEGEFANRPPKGIEKAEHFRIAESYRFVAADEIRAALHKYGPVVCGVSVYESAFKPKVKKTGMIPDPSPKESLRGGHAICIVGYDDDKRLFKFKNSWGPEWGDQGYGYISYTYMKESQSESWAFTI